MREPPNISEEHLRACLQQEYGIAPVAVEYLARGADYNAGVFRILSEKGAAYLLKVKSGALYEAGCVVPRYLVDQGITSVVAPIPTTGAALWTTLDDWNVILYPYIEGNTSFYGMTDGEWRETGALFRQIHQVRFSAERFGAIRKETFDPAAYNRWVSDFQTEQLPHLRDGVAPARAVRDSWVTHQSTINTMVASLERLSAALRSRPLPQVICHADLHPANLLRDHGGHVHVIDWDDVMLAPKERDFIFVWEPEADAFWQGYGSKDLDQAALAYYNWERVITDLIAYANDACFRADLSEESRAELAASFDLNLRGRNLAAAKAAEAKLN